MKPAKPKTRVKVREQAEEIERLKKERDGAVKQALEQHRIVQDLGRELRAANGRTERVEKALRSVLTHPDTTGRLQELVSEALRPAAPEAKESDCTCGEQWPCPLHGGPPSAPEPTPSAFCGPGCAQFHDQPCAEEPDLPPTPHRTPEEIAEEWFKIHDGMCVRSIDGQPYREHFLAALREATDAPSRQIADEARYEEREALREWAKQTSYRDVIALNQVLVWIDVRSRAEKPKV